MRRNFLITGMRYFLLFLALFVQLNASGYTDYNPLKNHAQKTLTPESSDCDGRSDVLFRYQGQYEDSETGLYYNRFRYLDPNTGNYISQDPIGLAGGNPTLYGYVKDVNSWVDVFGLFELFRSVSRSEYYDIKDAGWRPSGGSMEGKWFAESYEDAVKWGHTMGHGTDSKFYILKVEVPDDIADSAFKHANLDGIGDARYLDVDTLNQHGKITEVNSTRVKCH